MIGADSVYLALKKMGVRHVFGMVSIHNMALFDAINRNGDIRIIDCRHEQAATHAADGYARVTGGPGVVIASTGPGTTNTVTGLYEAAYSSSPVLLITGQAETAFLGKGQGYVHEAETQKAMLETLLRRVDSVTHADTIYETMINSCQSMLTGRPQPCAVEIPVDLQYARLTREPDTRRDMNPIPVPWVEEDQLDHAARLISDSNRRIILVGGGAQGAGATILSLAENLNAPILTTHNGRGTVPENHPLVIGNLYQSRRLYQDLSEADLTIAIGTRFQVGVNGAGAEMKPPGKLLHINIDPGALNRVHRADLAINGEAGQVLKAIENRINFEAGDEDFLKRIQASAEGVKLGLRKRMGKDYERMMDLMRELLPDDAMMVRDTTVPAYNFTNQLLPVYHPRSYLGSSSAAIGPGLPLALGVSTATGKRTMVISGDGGFMLHAAEMATAAQYRLPLLICVFNDGGYGVLRGLQTRSFEGRVGEVNLGFMDFVRMAESMGVPGRHVKSLEDFEAGFTHALNTEGPFLLDIDMRCFELMQGSILPEKSP